MQEHKVGISLYFWNHISDGVSIFCLSCCYVRTISTVCKIHELCDVYFFGLLWLEKNYQMANIHRPFLQKGHISCAYATCSYFCMGERNCSYDIKIPVWGIPDDSGVQILLSETSNKMIMILGVTWILPFTWVTTFNSTFPRINWNYVTTYEIAKIFKSVKANNSYGYSHKNSKIKHPFYHFPLTYICNKSFSSGVFPERQI